MRIALLWTGLSGYLNACLRELASRPGVQLFVAHAEIKSEAPYEESLFSWIKLRFGWQDEGDFQELYARLTKFDPEVVVVAGWHVPIYRRIMKPLKGRCLRIMTMDNRWNGTLRQRIGTIMAPIHIHPYADAAWVPGHDQVDFARRVGFTISDIITGSYSCEYLKFSTIYEERITSGRSLPKAFIFVGRLLAIKGVDTLAAAYERYRSSAKDPWPLIVCGTGNLDSLLVGKPGVHFKGFVQPDNLPRELATAGCLILPSSFEPWALVVNEATAAGLIVVATERVGAVPHLVQNYYNGFVVNANDSTRLAQVMTEISEISPLRRERMSSASHELSRQYTPKRWADVLLDFATDRKFGQQKGLPYN